MRLAEVANDNEVLARQAALALSDVLHDVKREGKVLKMVDGLITVTINPNHFGTHGRTPAHAYVVLSFPKDSLKIELVQREHKRGLALSDQIAERLRNADLFDYNELGGTEHNVLHQFSLSRRR